MARESIPEKKKGVKEAPIVVSETPVEEEVVVKSKKNKK